VSRRGVTVLLLALPLAAQQDPQALSALEPVIAAAVARVEGSVVTIETFGGARRRIGPDPAQDPQPQPTERPGRPPPKGIAPPGFLQAQGTSTGLVLSADGWILTSSFALNFDPTTIVVTLADGRTLEARRGGEDTSRGLALLKIDAAGLPVPEFVPPEQVRVGQWALALGRTFGSGRRPPSVHLGIVSARGRLFGRALQTDAWTSPANYGGPLVDAAGRVLGILAPLSMSGRDAGVEFYDSGIGFAATIAGIEPLLERMQAGETLHRGFLGVTNDPDDLGPGANVTAVAKDSPAARAGLAPKDRILAIDGVELRHSFHLQLLVSSKLAGDPVHLRVRSPDGAERAITVMLAPVPGSERAPATLAGDVSELPWEEERKDR
jgi:serine protease Do